MKKNNDWVFIINPVAGNGYAKTLEPKIEEMIEKHGVNASIVFTKNRGHGAEIAKEYYNDGVKNIIAVGGDGTINEIAGSLKDAKEVTIGIVPAGTGNDFIQILGFPNRFEEEHWDTLFNKPTIEMDMGICNNQAFFNGMGLGFDAQVAAENYTEPGEVKKGGKSKYWYQIIKTLLFYREKKMKVLSTQNPEESDCFINTVSIGRRFAGDFYLTPKAIANDGLLDVCMIEKLTLLQRLKILTMVPKGTHVEDKKVNYYTTERIEIAFDREVPFHLDGELHYAKDFNIGIIPKALSVIYNPQGNHFFDLKK